VALLPAAVGLAGASAGLLYQQRFCGRMDLRTGTATQLLVSVPVLGVLTLAIEPIRISHPLELAGSLTWLVMVNSIGAVTLLYAMLRHRPASQVSSLIFLSPAVTAILAYLIVGQSLGWLTIAGRVVSGVGVSFTTRTPAAPAPRGHTDRDATRDPGSRVTASRAGAVSR
jgi:drug/metabolite transporter (DMT)-like permease